MRTRQAEFSPRAVFLTVLFVGTLIAVVGIATSRSARADAATKSPAEETATTVAKQILAKQILWGDTKSNGFRILSTAKNKGGSRQLN